MTLRFQSAKRASDARVRRQLVGEKLASDPICERCSSAPSCDVHEVVGRGRGGSFLDRRLFKALCRQCHDFVGANPAIARTEGFELPKGALRHQFTPDDIGYRCSDCNLPAMNWRHNYDQEEDAA